MQVQQDEEWDDWVRQAFKSLDSNQDGVICEEDMRMTSVDLDEVMLLCMLHSFCAVLNTKLACAAYLSQPSFVSQQPCHIIDASRLITPVASAVLLVKEALWQLAGVKQGFHDVAC